MGYTDSLRIAILSRDFYPDVKRGGTVFAEKLHDLLRQYVKRIDAIAMFWSISVKGRNNHVYALRVPRGLSCLLFLPLYILFAINVVRKGRHQFIISNGVYEALIPLVLNRPIDHSLS